MYAVSFIALKDCNKKIGTVPVCEHVFSCISKAKKFKKSLDRSQKAVIYRLLDGSISGRMCLISETQLTEITWITERNIFNEFGDCVLIASQKNKNDKKFNIFN